MYYSVYVITFIIEFVAFKITQAEKMDASTSKGESLQKLIIVSLLNNSVPRKLGGVNALRVYRY